MSFEGFKKGLKNIVTFGASGRIEKAMRNYEETYNQYESILEKQVELENDLKNNFEELKNIKIYTQNIVSKIKYFFEPNEKKRENNVENFDVSIASVAYVHKSLGNADMVINTAKGLASGASAGLTAWAIAGTIGTASTGTAISALSGAAATNAMLAWFGGGALSAGGLGMAGGTAVLGGIVAVPALIAMGIFNHVKAGKEIKDIKEKEYEIVEAIGMVETNILNMEIYQAKTHELIESLQKGCEAFSYLFNKTKKELFPLGKLSKFFRFIKSKFTKKYYSIKDYEQINLLYANASNLLKIRDTNIIENKRKNNNE